MDSATDDLASGCGCVFYILICCVVVAWQWHGKLRYAAQYNVPYSNVTIQDEPHDCEFMTAPLGNKNCHYERVVFAIQTGHASDGRPTVSFDGGQTWQPDDGASPATPSVTVSWTKVQEGK